jgi:F0F1-type ATP synthase membrane subunit b/b'
MTDWTERIDDMIETLRQQRDELELKMHLGKAEAKTELEKLDKKLEHLVAEAKAQSKPLREAAVETAGDVGSALELLGDEIRKGFERLRDSVK